MYGLNVSASNLSNLLPSKDDSGKRCSRAQCALHAQEPIAVLIPHLSGMWAVVAVCADEEKKEDEGGFLKNNIFSLIQSKFELIIGVQHTLTGVVSAIERLRYLLSWQALAQQ